MLMETSLYKNRSEVYKSNLKPYAWVSYKLILYITNKSVIVRTGYTING